MFLNVFLIKNNNEIKREHVNNVQEFQSRLETRPPQNLQ